MRKEKALAVLSSVPKKEDLPLKPNCDYCKKENCANGIWYQLLNGHLAFMCSQCSQIKEDEKGEWIRIDPVGYPIYYLRKGILEKIERTITQKLRISSYSMYGKRISFWFKTGRRKIRVKGRFFGIFHNPEEGFVIDVERVIINGQYCTGRFEFPVRQIIWKRKLQIEILALPKSNKSAS
ncbi:MAG: hypothetical protein D4S01_00260 [Dehalococcoidia bacterium]|nr:MAG: hypothetical protein D4S01_00260 [Dehalococcoidia bacterium]